MYHPIPLLPQQIIVPGEDTPEGQRYRDTFANDHRQNLPWSDKHELQILHLLASVRSEGDFNVPSEPLSVFRVDRDDGTLVEGESRFDLITDDGRQRRRDGIVLNERLHQIARDYYTNILDGTLYDALVKATYKWMSPTFAEELATGPWFDPSAKPRLLKFRVDIVAANPDLKSHKLLLDNVRRKEASIPTPLPALAKQYTSLLSATDAQGKPVFTSVAKLAEAIGKTVVHVRSVLDYERIEPELREAVDKGTCGLGLIVSGADCIAFGADHKLLPPEHQISVFRDLVKAFAVEIDDGIPDNKTTRRMVAALKAKLGHETVKRADAGRSERIAERAAARLGIRKAEAGTRDEAIKTKPMLDSVRERETVYPGTQHQPAKPSVDDLKDLKNPTVRAVVKYLNGDMTKLALLQAVGEISADDIETVLIALSKIERHVGDLRSLPPADFDRAIRAMVSEKTYDMVVSDIMSAYNVPKTRRHVDIGVHVREMLGDS